MFTREELEAIRDDPRAAINFTIPHRAVIKISKLATFALDMWDLLDEEEWREGPK